MHDPTTSRERKNFNSTCKTTKIKFSAALVDKKKNSPELGAAESFNLSKLRTLLQVRFFDDNLSCDVVGSALHSSHSSLHSPCFGSSS